MNWKKDILYSFNEYVKEKEDMGLVEHLIFFSNEKILEHIEQFIEDIQTDEYGDWEDFCNTYEDITLEDIYGLLVDLFVEEE